MDRFKPGDKVRVTGVYADRFPNGTTFIRKHPYLDNCWLVDDDNGWPDVDGRPCWAVQESNLEPMTEEEPKVKPKEKGSMITEVSEHVYRVMLPGQSGLPIACFVTLAQLRQLYIEAGIALSLAIEPLAAALKAHHEREGG